MPAGRPPKEILENVEQTEEAPLQKEIPAVDIKQIVRGINVTNQFGTDGSEPVDVVNDYINSFLHKGYKLVHVQHLRSNMGAEGNAVVSEQMLYVLVKQ